MFLFFIKNIFNYYFIILENFFFIFMFGYICIKEVYFFILKI